MTKNLDLTEISEKELETVSDEFRKSKENQDFGITEQKFKLVNESIASQTIPGSCIICLKEAKYKGTGWALCNNPECYQKLDKILSMMYRYHV